MTTLRVYTGFCTLKVPDPLTKKGVYWCGPDLKWQPNLKLAERIPLLNAWGFILENRRKTHKDPVETAMWLSVVLCKMYHNKEVLPVEFFKRLTEEVWVPSEEGVVSLHPARGLTEEEWSEILRLTQEEPLVVEMIMTNMFGGVGVRFFSHPDFPGLPPTYLFTVTERMIPGQSLKAPTGGSASREAYRVFYDLATTEKNKGWVKDYKLRAAKSFVDYCY